MSELLRHVLATTVIGAIIVACAGPPAAPDPTPDPTPEPIGLWPISEATPAAGATAVQATLIRSPNCSCCGGHAEHLLAAGYDVKSVFTEAFTTVKDSHAVPEEMRSCHTTLVDSYFVEGHVPVAAIEQLLAERPDIDGIALPGMPAGSPGMGGIAGGPLTIWAIDGGRVIGEFGRFEAPVD